MRLPGYDQWLQEPYDMAADEQAREDRLMEKTEELFNKEVRDPKMWLKVVQTEELIEELEKVAANLAIGNRDEVLFILTTSFEGYIRKYCEIQARKELERDNQPEPEED